VDSSVSTSAHPLFKTAARFGLGAGLLSIGWELGLYLTGNNPYGPKRLLATLFGVGAVLLSQWYVRRYYEAEGIGIGKALGVGVLTVLITALLSSAGIYGLARMAGPEAIQRHLAEMEQLLKANKAEFLKQANGKEQYELTKQNLAQTPQAFAADDFKNKLLFGLLICLPGGIFFRK